MRTIVLASASPRRQQLLQQIGLSFHVHPSKYEEDMTLDLPPSRLAMFLSRGKAEEVAIQYHDALIIAADTFIVFRGKILGKPHTRENAQHMLQAINGRMHKVITGFTIIDTKTKKTISRAVSTKIYVKKLSHKEINHYIEKDNILEFAGSYAIQKMGVLLIQKIEGDYFNVVGLPLFSLVKELSHFGVTIL